MAWQSSARSDVGRLRSHNEDAFLARDDVGLFVVADGMGGHAGGEVASAIAVEAIEEALTEREGDLASRAADAIRRANESIRDAARRDRRLAGMGTTATVLVLDHGAYHIAHVGDSRAYLLRDDTLRRITVDHTWVQEQVEKGVLNEFEAREHPYSSVLTRALGTESGVDVDVYDGAYEPGELFLLCSDGLTAVLTDDDIADLLQAPGPIDARADALIEAANAGGGPDNITVVLVSTEA